ncbi:MAG: nuclear transport factor 2 family protein [Paracoccaceae bacterium]
MAFANKDRVSAMLKSIETGDPEPISVVNEAKYIQHNPQTHEGSEGLAVLFARLSKTKPRVNIVRAFEDGDYVFAHTEYDFSRRNIGFEVFRFEDGQAVEHWDNIQPRLGPNASGHSMVDGPTVPNDLDQTEQNRVRIGRFVETVLIGRRFDLAAEFLAPEYAEHNPSMTDGLASFEASLNAESDGHPTIMYDRLHRVLVEGSFALTVSEGYRTGHHTSFYDLFRIEDGIIVEHWDTTEKIAPQSEWKNENGNF